MVHTTILYLAAVTLMALWVVYRRNPELFLCCLLFLNFECFYLLPQIGEAENYKMLVLTMFPILLCELALRRKLTWGRYGHVIVSFLLLSAIAVAVALVSGQEIILGIKAAKMRILALAYFFVVALEINDVKFAKYFVIMGVVVAGIIFLGYALYGHINIFAYAPAKDFHVRSGHLRMVIGAPLIAASACVAFARFVRTSSAFYLAAAVLLFMEMMFIQQIRIYVAGIFLSMLVLYGLSRSISVGRILVYVMVALVFMAFWQFWLKSGVENVGLVKLTQSEVMHQGGSYGARVQAYAYYWREIETSIFFGNGIRHSEWEKNPELRMQLRGIHLSDIGIMHLFVESGVLGLIWLVFALFFIWRDIIKFRNFLHISSYVVLATIIIPLIDLLIRSDTAFVFVTFLGILSKSIDRQLSITD